MQIDFVTTGLKMLGALVLMVGVIAALNISARRFLRRQVPGKRGRRVSILESTLLGVKKSITLVRVPGSVLVLGVTGDRITLLDKIPEALLEAEGAVPVSPPEASFHDQLRNVARRLTGSVDAVNTKPSVKEASSE